jgi:TonB family protein
VVGGFDRAVAPSRPRPSAEVAAAGFDLAIARAPIAAPKPIEVVTPLVRADVPVEIVYKPVPEYTAAARQLRIQGTVFLDVEFTASGAVRVLRLISGLGEGLDESAIRAAEAIRFKPARARGVAVDVRATIQIVFRLT